MVEPPAAPSDALLRQLTEKAGALFLAHQLRLVTAESCTGGWLSRCVTDLPGSSRWFECGYVTYSNEAKMRDLGVLGSTLERHGAVSEATASEMAEGALRVSGADVAVAVTGIAGPDGGTAEKPVGTVWFAVARRETGSVETRKQRFIGDRDRIRRDSVRYALEWLVAIQFLPKTTTV
jgi:nicotinamide-nucleotide amidase